MPATEPECRFKGDKFERCVRKCIVFPADGSPTRISHMIIETVTATEDISALCMYSRCVDLTGTFGAEHRNLKTRSLVLTVPGALAYLFFYNRSLRLPINLNVANLVGVTPSHLRTKKRMFWRGDIVVMKVRSESEAMDFMVEALDADLSELGSLEDVLRIKHQEGFLEQDLHSDEMQWKSYVTNFAVPGSLFGGPETYWGKNAAQKEESFLSDINEQRSAIGRAPLPRPDHMKSTTTSGLSDTFYSSFQSAFQSLLGQKAAGPPKLPPELERQILETCALDCPEVCTDLVLVSKTVYAWLDPVLIATVCITEDFQSQRQGKLKSFLSKLSSGKMPVEYYVQHVKNLAIFGGIYEEGEIDRVLAICTGVENLVINKMVILNQPVKSLAFFDNPQAGTALRRLYVNLWWNTSDASAMPNFDYALFHNLTHLHLADDDENWPFYTGWENLERLTHLAFACCSSEQLEPVMQVLPAIRYVALGHYHGGEQYRYADVVVNNSPQIREAWDVRVVFLQNIPRSDWERGARGEGDFWDVVEDEVERRLQDGSG